ncbi:hypothetical protein VH569_22810 [Azospirillum sp. 11R-A]|uniref:hypothetical protein n=1 Tax=Azospirillum sp. 11R-A TaxID=3111634 RepID=UPI003C23873D
MEHERQLGFVFLQHEVDGYFGKGTPEGENSQNVVTFVQVKAERVKAELVQQLDRSGVLAVGRR